MQEGRNIFFHIVADINGLAALWRTCIKFRPFTFSLSYDKALVCDIRKTSVHQLPGFSVQLSPAQKPGRCFQSGRPCNIIVDICIKCIYMVTVKCRH